MVRVILVAILAVLAGCLGPSGTFGTDDGRSVDMSFFEACPVDRGYTVPCEGNATNPFWVEVADSWPTGWMCLTFADERLADPMRQTYYPYPDWYTLFGPALQDGAGGPEFQMGFAYDAHNDTDRVGGAIRLLTEDREELFTFEGPSRGFVRIPVPIAGPKLSYVGVLYPATLGAVSEQYAFPPDYPENVTPPMNHLNISGLDGTPSPPFWSLGPYREANPPPDVTHTFDAVRNVAADGTEYHFPATPRHQVGILDHTDLQGLANWGMGRGDPYNTTVRHGPIDVEGILQPYMFFGAKFDDVHNPAYLAVSNWLCGCFGSPLTTVEGILCFVGVQSPLVTAAHGIPSSVTVPFPGAPPSARP